jgi:hypothetical protein
VKEELDSGFLLSEKLLIRWAAAYRLKVSPKKARASKSGCLSPNLIADG